VVFNEEIEILRGDGSRGTILSSAAPLRAPDGRMVGGVTTFVDITEKRATERQLKETLEQAQRAESVQRIVAEASQQLAESFHEGSTVKSILRLALPRVAEWCAVFLTAPDQQLHLKELAHVDPLESEGVHEIFERAPLSGQPGTFSYEAFRQQRPLVVPVVTDEVLAKWSPSEEHLAALRELGIVSLMGLPLVARGRSLGVVLFASARSRKVFSPEDLTLAQELAQRSAFAIDNERLHEQARGEIQLREDLLAIIAHDLRNPLASVLVHADLLTDSPDKPVSVAEHALHILKAARRMERLVHDLVDFEALGTGRLSIERESSPPTGPMRSRPPRLGAP
jgi:GAF domain-containing protein